MYLKDFYLVLGIVGYYMIGIEASCHILNLEWHFMEYRFIMHNIKCFSRDLVIFLNLGNVIYVDICWPNRVKGRQKYRPHILIFREF